MRIRTAIAATLVVLASTGCSAIESLTDPPVHIDLEIHNRTLDDLVFENDAGQRVEVTACESLRVEAFSVDAVQVRAEGGNVRGFGAGAPENAGREMHLIEVASAEDRESRSSVRRPRTCHRARATRRRSPGPEPRRRP